MNIHRWIVHGFHGALGERFRAIYVRAWIASLSLNLTVEHLNMWPSRWHAKPPRTTLRERIIARRTLKKHGCQ